MKNVTLFPNISVLCTPALIEKRLAWYEAEAKLPFHKTLEDCIAEIPHRKNHMDYFIERLWVKELGRVRGWYK